MHRDSDATEATRAAKAAMRLLVTRRIEALSRETRRRWEAQIVEAVLQEQVWHTAAVVLGYIAMEGEADPAELVHIAAEQGKIIALPRINRGSPAMTFHPVEVPERDLERHPYGFLQPVGRIPEIVLKDKPVVVLTPGRAFDRCGGRLGHGGGYYDRFLAEYRTTVVAMGIAYGCQLVDGVPRGPHDQAVHMVVTEQGVFPGG